MEREHGSNSRRAVLFNFEFLEFWIWDCLGDGLWTVLYNCIVFCNRYRATRLFGPSHFAGDVVWIAKFVDSDISSMFARSARLLCFIVARDLCDNGTPRVTFASSSIQAFWNSMLFHRRCLNITKIYQRHAQPKREWDLKQRLSLIDLL